MSGQPPALRLPSWIAPLGSPARAALLAAEARRVGLSAEALDALLAHGPRPRSHILDWGGRSVDLGQRTQLIATLDACMVIRRGGNIDETTVEELVIHAEALVGAGADVLEIGLRRRDWTMPDERARICAAVAALAQRLPDVPVIVHTPRVTVAEAALDAGARAIHAVSVRRQLNVFAELAAPRRVPLFFTPHNFGGGVPLVLGAFMGLHTRLRMPWQHVQLVVDPGLGLPNNFREESVIIRELRDFAGFRLPLAVGHCFNPGFLSHSWLSENEPDWPAAAATLSLVIANGASLVRLGTVAWENNRPTVAIDSVTRLSRVVRMTDAIVRAPLDD